MAAIEKKKRRQLSRRGAESAAAVGARSAFPEGTPIRPTAYRWKEKSQLERPGGKKWRAGRGSRRKQKQTNKPAEKHYKKQVTASQRHNCSTVNETTKRNENRRPEGQSWFLNGQKKRMNTRNKWLSPLSLLVHLYSTEPVAGRKTRSTKANIAADTPVIIKKKFFTRPPDAFLMICSLLFCVFSCDVKEQIEYFSVTCASTWLQSSHSRPAS